MTSYSYEAVDPSGLRMQGTIDVASQSEALRRIKEMGLYPTRVAERHFKRPGPLVGRRSGLARFGDISVSLPIIGGRIKVRAIAVLTRQLATLVEAGMPLLRGLRILQQQESNRTLRRILEEVDATIEGGNSLSEALALHPKVFNRLYVNMVKTGKISGALEIALRRLAEF